jgi:hypothetical protein
MPCLRANKQGMRHSTAETYFVESFQIFALSPNSHPARAKISFAARRLSARHELAGT